MLGKSKLVGIDQRREPKGSADSSKGDINRMPHAFIHAEPLRAMAIEAAVPSTAEKIIVQNAMMRLFQAAQRNTIAHTTAQALKKEVIQ
jgi:hypothetical protein